MPDDGGSEKSEFPTPRKREEAREEGQVSFSTDVNTSIILLTGFSTLAIMAPWFWSAMSVAIRRAVSDDLTYEVTDGHSLMVLLGHYMPVAHWIWPFLGVIFVVAIAVSIAQVGFHPSLKPLMPKLSRVNPLTGLQRLFGLRGFMRFVFSFTKLLVVLAIAYSVLTVDIPAQLYVAADIKSRMANECWHLFVLAMKLSAVIAIIAAGDYLYQRYQHTKDLMMTKQEIKEEMKQSDGDPQVKGRIRRIQREMAQKRMMQKVPKADVVITNPTHVAVALKYNKDEMAAPVVVAKGYDDVAQRIKAIAAEHGIAMVENVTLARALAKDVEIGHIMVAAA